MNRRAEYLREHYPHEHGVPLISTAEMAALMGTSPRTALRRMKGADVEPARRGGHGRMWWRHADVMGVLDNESQRCHSDG